MLKFPALRFHENDGGRYFGPGGGLINRDPDSGYVNTGTYRMQLHDKNTLGLWMSPGQNGRQICMKYWEKGKSCPVVATYGQHPLVFMPSYTKFPYGSSEMEVSGGLIGKPLEVLLGPITGLPIPASSEIAIEGEVPPPSEDARDEGPFGNGPAIIPVAPRHGRQTADHSSQSDLSPQRPDPGRRSAVMAGRREDGFAYLRGVLWDQLESAGIQDIVGVYNHTSYLTGSSIKQKYAGHAKQAGLAAVSAARRRATAATSWWLMKISIRPIRKKCSGR